LSTVTDAPLSSARATHAELMVPVPPMKRIVFEAMLRSWQGCRALVVRLPRSCRVPAAALLCAERSLCCRAVRLPASTSGPLDDKRTCRARIPATRRIRPTVVW
jgi:hypothetical protein